MSETNNTPVAIPDLYQTQGKRAGIANPSWHQTINALLQNNYYFLPLSFAQGYLFRAVPLTTEPDRIMHSMTRQERRLGIYFCSAHLSDALTVSKLWHSDAKTAIVVLPSYYFQAQLEAGNAAVLGFAEGGQIFNYPFFCHPPDDIDNSFMLVSVNNKTLLPDQAARRLLTISAASASRSVVEKQLETLFSIHAINPAKKISVQRVPRLLPVAT